MRTNQKRKAQRDGREGRQKLFSAFTMLYFRSLSMRQVCVLIRIEFWQEGRLKPWFRGQGELRRKWCSMRHSLSHKLHPKPKALFLPFSAKNSRKSCTFSLPLFHPFLLAQLAPSDGALCLFSAIQKCLLTPMLLCARGEGDFQSQLNYSLYFFQTLGLLLYFSCYPSAFQ